MLSGPARAYSKVILHLLKPFCWSLKVFTISYWCHALGHLLRFTIPVLLLLCLYVSEKNTKVTFSNAKSLFFTLISITLRNDRTKNSKIWHTQLKGIQPVLFSLVQPLLHIIGKNNDRNLYRLHVLSLCQHYVYFLVCLCTSILFLQHFNCLV